jgi:hypothetical protein
MLKTKKEKKTHRNRHTARRAGSTKNKKKKTEVEWFIAFLIFSPPLVQIFAISLCFMLQKYRCGETEA